MKREAGQNFRIVEEPGVNGGAPTPSGTYMTVEQILRAVGSGETPAHIRREYGLTRFDLAAVVDFARADSRFAALLAQENVRTALAALGFERRDR